MCHLFLSLCGVRVLCFLFQKKVYPFPSFRCWCNQAADCEEWELGGCRGGCVRLTRSVWCDVSIQCFPSQHEKLAEAVVSSEKSTPSPHEKFNQPFLITTRETADACIIEWVCNILNLDTRWGEKKWGQTFWIEASTQQQVFQESNFRNQFREFSTRTMKYSTSTRVWLIDGN